MSLIATFNIGDVVAATSSSSSQKNKKKHKVGCASSARPPLLRSSIYLGSKDDAKSLDLLEKRRISHILNVTPSKTSGLSVGVPNYFEKSGKFTYCRIPLFDDATSVKEMRSKYATQIVDFIHRGLYHGNVLVHCHHGISRSTTCVALYLMSKRDMTLPEAMTMIQRRRPQAQPIPAFLEYLKQQDAALQQERNETSQSTIALASAKRSRTAAASPIGPRPPTNAADNSNDEDEFPRKKRFIMDPSVRTPQAVTIGPSLPPPSSLTDVRDKCLDTNTGEDGTSVVPNEKERTTCIGPSLPRTNDNVVVGPSLPPPPAKTEPGKNNDNRSTKSKPSHREIGPALPPGFSS